MKPNSIKVAMVQSAVKKGIKDIKDDPKRGIRNLVELGELFSTGPFQQDFFAMAMNQLHDESSAYYRIVQRTVKDTDEDMLSTFGVNLGYKALVHGAGIIRSIEKKSGFNVPWCLMLEVADGQMLPRLDIENIIEQGKELGIYCYILHFDANSSCLGNLFEILYAQKDCAFLLLLQPAMINDAFCRSLFALHNALPVLNIDHISDGELRQVTKKLSRAGSLFGGFTLRQDFAPADISSKFLQWAETMELSALVFVRTKKHHPQNEDDVYHKIEHLRKNLDVPVLPIDFYGDIAQVDRAISTQACLIAIKKDGGVVLNDVDKDRMISGYNIYDSSLREILKCAMPNK